MSMTESYICRISRKYIIGAGAIWGSRASYIVDGGALFFFFFFIQTLTYISF